MKRYEFIDNEGSFRLEAPENTGGLYFPLTSEAGMKSSITPMLSGDAKVSQNAFLLAPVSSEDLHNGRGSRNFWCRFENGEIWSATGNSARQRALMFTGEQENSALTAGFLWHQMERESQVHQLAATIFSFVPEGEQMEIMRVTLRNTGNKPVTLTPTAAIPLYCRSADNIRDHRHVTSLLNRIKTTKQAVIVEPTLTFDERGHKMNELVYYAAGMTGEGKNPSGFYPTVIDFIGEGGSLDWPESLLMHAESSKEEVLKVEPLIEELLKEEAQDKLSKTGSFKTGTTISGYEAMGGISFDQITLQPSQEAVYLIFLGIAVSEEQVQDIMNRYPDNRAVETALTHSKQAWEEKLKIQFKIGDHFFGKWMKWVSLQPILRRIYGCSFLPHHDYGRGGRGWRDLWQDCLALLMMNPGGVRGMLIDYFAGVRFDGTNATIIGSKQGEFIADRNNITRVWMDHGVWPLMTTDRYIEQTGDYGILLETNTYFKDRQAVRGQEKDTEFTEDGKPVLYCSGINTDRTDIVTNNDKKDTLDDDEKLMEYRGSILEHLLIENLTAYYDVGEHNHCRLRGADWNDALDMAPERGESVAFTAAYAGNLHTLAKLVRYLKENGTQKVVLAKELMMLIIPEESKLLTAPEESKIPDTSEEPGTDSGILNLSTLQKAGDLLYNNISTKQELLKQFGRICSHTISGETVLLDSEILATILEKMADRIQTHIRETEWIQTKEHAWFNGYYDNNGRAVEGEFETGVRMMLTGQVFAVMSGTATNEQIQAITKAADAYLYQEDIGGYRLNTDFKEVKTDLGRMFGFAFGHKENGAVFSHMSVMYANALYKRGFVKEGYKVLTALYQQAANFETSCIYPGIPEYFNDRGRGMYHYLTGAASWLTLTVLSEMFGIRGKCGNLIAEPKLLAEQFDTDGYCEAVFPFGGHEFLLILHNPRHLEYGQYQIGRVTLDGETILQKKDVVITKQQLNKMDKKIQHRLIIELI